MEIGRIVCVSDSGTLMIKLMNFVSILCVFCEMSVRCELFDVVRMESLFAHCAV